MDGVEESTLSASESRQTTQLLGERSLMVTEPHASTVQVSSEVVRAWALDRDIFTNLPARVQNICKRAMSQVMAESSAQDDKSIEDGHAARDDVPHERCDSAGSIEMLNEGVPGNETRSRRRRPEDDLPRHRDLSPRSPGSLPPVKRLRRVVGDVSSSPQPKPQLLSPRRPPLSPNSKKRPPGRRGRRLEESDSNATGTEEVVMPHPTQPQKPGRPLTPRGDFPEQVAERMQVEVASERPMRNLSEPRTVQQACAEWDWEVPATWMPPCDIATPWRRYCGIATPWMRHCGLATPRKPSPCNAYGRHESARCAVSLPPISIKMRQLLRQPQPRRIEIS